VEEIARHAAGKRLAVFLDYDGTLTPIVDHPDQAVLSDDMRAAVSRLARCSTVAVISGRDVEDVRDRVGVPDVIYAGGHGFDISGPKGQEISFQQGTDFLPVLHAAEKDLREKLVGVPGHLLERKRFSIAVHYRNVPDQAVETVHEIVRSVLLDHPELRDSPGKKVHDLQPRMDWHKGKAVEWLLQALGLEGPSVLPLFIGDDITDEDAFRQLRDHGVTVVVRDGPRDTWARYALEDPDDVGRFLARLTDILTGGA
jgi:alpha,alpha-trehalase